MEFSIFSQINLSFENGELSVANLAAAVKDLKLEQMVVEAVIEEINRKEVEKHCGNRYTRGNGANRFQQAGTVERHPVTFGG